MKKKILKKIFGSLLLLVIVGGTVTPALVPLVTFAATAPAPASKTAPASASSATPPSNTSGNTNTINAQQDNAAVGSACGGSGHFWDLGFPSASCLLDFIVAWVAYFIMMICAWIMALVGMLFDAVMSYTVVNMKNNLDGFSIINSGWADIRDIGNLIFIFLAIYLGIQEIIGLNFGNTKRLVRNLIIVGLLVNFSLFFTQLLIDASNILALSFYNLTIHIPSITNNSFTKVFAGPLGLPTVYNLFPPASSVNRLADLGFLQIIIVGIGSSLFFLVTSVTFLGATALFVIRFLIFIFLMVLSPLAFLFSIVPGKLQEISKQWWQTLSGQLIFAPLYMVLILLVALIINSGGVNVSALSSALTANIAATPVTTAAAQAAASGLSATSNNIGTCTSTNPGSCSVIYQIFFFIFIIFLMNGALIIALQYAAKGGGISGAAVGWIGAKAKGAMGAVYRAPVGFAGQGAASVTGRAGRALIGATAGKLSDKEKSETGRKLHDLLGSKSSVKRTFARATLGALENTKKASFDFRNTKTVQGFGKKSGINFGEGKGEGGYEKQKERESAKLNEQYEKIGAGTKETTQRLRQNRADEAQAQHKMTEVIAEERKFQEEEAATRQRVETEHRNSSKEERDQKVKQAVEELRSSESYKAMAQRKVEAMTQLRNAKSATKETEKTVQKEIRAKQSQFALENETRVTKRGGFNVFNVIHGKHAEAYRDAARKISSGTKTAEKGKKVDENKEKAEAITPALQSAIDAGNSSELEGLLKKTDFSVLKHIDKKILFSNQALNILMRTPGGRKLAESTATTLEYKQKVENARPNQVTTNETNEGGGGI